MPASAPGPSPLPASAPAQRARQHGHWCRSQYWHRCPSALAPDVLSRPWQGLFCWSALTAHLMTQARLTFVDDELSSTTSACPRRTLVVDKRSWTTSDRPRRTFGFDERSSSTMARRRRTFVVNARSSSKPSNLQCPSRSVPCFGVQH